VDSHPISISSAAVDLARILGFWPARLYGVGAGEMSELTPGFLLQDGDKQVLVSNRSYEKAQAMAAQFGGRLSGLMNLPERMKPI
jgi:glutamyl-tRNA reductase